MKALPLVAATAAVIGLTACTESAGRSDAPGGNGSTRTPIAPVSCSEQYRSWTKGDGKGVMGALDAVTTAARAGDARALTGALKHAGPAVAKAAEHPIPACADPRGFWSVLLMHVSAAAGQGSAASVRAAMQDVPKIHQQLVAEVRQAAQ